MVLTRDRSGSRDRPTAILGLLICEPFPRHLREGASDERAVRALRDHHVYWHGGAATERDALVVLQRSPGSQAGFDLVRKDVRIAGHLINLLRCHAGGLVVSVS